MDFDVFEKELFRAVVYNNETFSTVQILRWRMWPIRIFIQMNEVICLIVGLDECYCTSSNRYHRNLINTLNYIYILYIYIEGGEGGRSSREG
jgi:hypothetical protein